MKKFGKVGKFVKPNEKSNLDVGVPEMNRIKNYWTDFDAIFCKMVFFVRERFKVI